MAKGPTTSFSGTTTHDFTRQNAEQVMQIANFGMNWMREMAEQNVNQSRVVLESLLMMTKKTLDNIDHQTSDLCHRSMSLAEETVGNTFDLAHRLVRARE